MPSQVQCPAQYIGGYLDFVCVYWMNDYIRLQIESGLCLLEASGQCHNCYFEE